MEVDPLRLVSRILSHQFNLDNLTSQSNLYDLSLDIEDIKHSCELLSDMLGTSFDRAKLQNIRTLNDVVAVTCIGKKRNSASNHDFYVIIDVMGRDGLPLDVSLVNNKLPVRATDVVFDGEDDSGSPFGRWTLCSGKQDGSNGDSDEIAIRMLERLRVPLGDLIKTYGYEVVVTFAISSDFDSDLVLSFRLISLLRDISASVQIEKY